MILKCEICGNKSLNIKSVGNDEILMCEKCEDLFRKKNKNLTVAFIKMLIYAIKNKNKITQSRNTREIIIEYVRKQIKK